MINDPKYIPIFNAISPRIPDTVELDYADDHPTGPDDELHQKATVTLHVRAARLEGVVWGERALGRMRERGISVTFVPEPPAGMVEVNSKAPGCVLINDSVVCYG